ncbi:proepiregulin [Rana temporaria]|uniref:proepiregulin n=1 Tax=Rana temporaria TaxID=8407 RepID=UPI001AACF38A|nr:proepiregulin [Rana temporaria]
MDCFRRISSVIIFLSFHMLQLVCGTTVIPLCKPGENCTTEMVKTTENPHGFTLKVSKCAPEMSNYCINGQCLYHEEADEHYCQCERGYLGLRCAHSELVKQPLNEEYLALIVFLTSMLLLVTVLAVFFALKWYRLKKSSQPDQKYMGVNTPLA